MLIFLFVLTLPLVNANKRNAELFLKFKRLKQIKSEGKTYQEYLTEIHRVKEVTIDNSALKALNETEQIERMKKIVKYKSANNMSAIAKRVIFLPDVSFNEKYRYFYNDLIKDPKFNATLVDMPNVYELNTKRYEVQWLKYMESLNLQDYNTIISHGSSSEALMRYLESYNITANPSHTRRVVFVDATDIYTAGERHGRRFLLNRIVDNCRTIDITFLVSRQNDTKLIDETNSLVSEFSNYEHELAVYTQQDSIIRTLLSFVN